MNKEDFDEWRKGPMTEFFMQYLADEIKDFSASVAEDISNGRLVEEVEQIRIGTQCLTLQRIIDLELDEIEDFYENHRRQSVSEDRKA